MISSPFDETLKIDNELLFINTYYYLFLPLNREIFSALTKYFQLFLLLGSELWSTYEWQESCTGWFGQEHWCKYRFCYTHCSYSWFLFRPRIFLAPKLSFSISVPLLSFVCLFLWLTLFSIFPYLSLSPTSLSLTPSVSLSLSVCLPLSLSSTYLAQSLNTINNMLLTGCGTSRHAAELGAKIMRDLDCFDTVSVLDAAEVRQD